MGDEFVMDEPIDKKHVIILEEFMAKQIEKRLHNHLVYFAYLIEKNGGKIEIPFSALWTFDHNYRIVRTEDPDTQQVVFTLQR